MRWTDAIIYEVCVCVCVALKREVEHIVTQEEISWGLECYVVGRVCLYERKCVCIQSVHDSQFSCVAEMLACSECMHLCNCVWS